MAKKDKRAAYLIALQLKYDKVLPDIKERIYAAESESEITRILVTARHMS